MSVKRSAISAALLEPFDDDVITQVEKRGGTFHNVAPHHYIKKLIDTAPGDYSIRLSPPIFHGKAAVSVNAEIVLHTDGGDRVSSANGSEALVDEDGNPTTDAETIANSIKNAQSDALKLAGKAFGLGLDLYFRDKNEAAKPARKAATKPKPAPVEDEEEEEEEEAPPARRRTTSSSRGRSGGGGGRNGGDWESKRDKFTYPLGKNKDTKYSALEPSFLIWATENLDPDHPQYGKKNADILKCVNAEIKYRKDNDLWEEPKPKKGSGKPTTKRRIDTDDEEDF